MTDFDGVDFFRTRSLYQDPYPYYDYGATTGRCGASPTTAW